MENRLESKLEEIPRATFFTQEINEVTRKVSNACDLLRIDLATGLSSASNALLGENSIGRISTGLEEETISVSNISDDAADAADVADVPTSDAADVPHYIMSRKIYNIKDLWKEYVYGLNGNPSIKSLESVYGTRWRPSAAETKYFTKRKAVYDCIERIIQNGEAEKTALFVVQKILEEERNKNSINKLAQNLRSRAVSIGAITQEQRSAAQQEE